MIRSNCRVLTDPFDNLAAAARVGNVAGMKIGIIKELHGEGYQAGVENRFNESLQLLKDAGAEIVEVSCPNLKYALGAYYLIMPSEASSNLAKFDGVRYGLRALPKDGPMTIERVMGATRAAGFGDEVKRHIILGTYALSAGYYDAYYGSAQKVRTLIQRDFDAAFSKADVLHFAYGSHHSVQTGGKGERSSGHVPERRRHHPRQYGRRAGLVAARWAWLTRTACPLVCSCWPLPARMPACTA